MAYWTRYSNGPIRLTENVIGYQQPDGGWGLNNTAVLIGRGETLMVDAAMDVPRTSYMIKQWREMDPAAGKIDHLIVTHWHVDHTVGLAAPELKQSNVIASTPCAKYMEENPPQAWMDRVNAMTGDARKAMEESLGIKFDLSILEYRKVDTVMTGKLEMKVGGRRVEALEVKPCHTRGDVIVNFPDDGIAHCGDLISAQRHAGLQYPFIDNHIGALELLLGYGAHVYVPGHGPLLTRDDIKEGIEYLNFLKAMARDAHAAGVDYQEAAERTLKNLGKFKDYNNPERLYINMKVLYAELDGDKDYFARKNNAEFVAELMRRRIETPKRFPELYPSF